MPQTPQTFVLSGGLDLVTPALLIPPGVCIAALNYEVEARGYRRVDGHERYDGRSPPSDAAYWALAFSNGSVAVVPGQTVTGGTSGATGTLLREVEVNSGSYGAGSARGLMYLYNVSGVFALGEPLRVSGAQIATAFSDAAIYGSPDDVTHNDLILQVATTKRAAVQKPPGSGPIRGVETYKGVLHCWRDNVAGTAGQMFRASSSGWVAVGTALPAGGTFRGFEKNFYGTVGGGCLYFVSSTGRAYEWNGTALAAINTGLSDALDKPRHIAEYKGHLWLAYEKGSVVWSSIGEPKTFSPTTGAGELTIGEAVTGLRALRDSLIIMGRNSIHYVVGTDAANFERKLFSEDSGAIEGTLEVIGEPIFMDDQGLRRMSAAETYGDWSMGTITTRVEPLIEAKKNVTPVALMRVRAKNQGRLYFSDGSALLIYFGREAPEIMPVSLSFSPTCFTSGENSQGGEVLFAGSSDGMVYRLDAGTSADGAPIEAFMRLAFNNQGSPGQEKRYHRARLQGKAGSRNSALAMVTDFSYGGDESPPGRERNFMMFGQGGFWDELVWNQFTWDSTTEGQAWAEIDGIGENVSIVIMSDSATETPHTLSAITINYTPRRRLR